MKQEVGGRPSIINQVIVEDGNGLRNGKMSLKNTFYRNKRMRRLSALEREEIEENDLKS